MRPAIVLLAGLLLAVGCAAPPQTGRPRRATSGRSGAAEAARPVPVVPPGVRLVSFDAERDRAATGAFLEPGWCVQLTAEVRDRAGKPVKGVPVSFRLDRRTGGGLVLAAGLSHELAISDEHGEARTLLVSSDRPEVCRVYAACGSVTLGARVSFARRRPPAFTVGLAGPRRGESRSPSPEAELDARVARLVRELARGGDDAPRVRKEITAMGSAAIGPLLRMIYDQTLAHGKRRLAAKALALVKDELVLERLFAALSDRRAAVRAGAEAGLFERGEKRAGKGVRRAARLSGSFGRASALRVLAAWGCPRDVITLAALAGSDPDPLVRATAAWKLKAFQEHSAARAALRAATADKSSFVRYTAAKASGLVGAVFARRGGLRLLKETFGDPDPRVRAAIAGAVIDARYLDELLTLSTERDLRVRRAATESLGRLLYPGAPRIALRLRILSADRDAHVSERAFRALVRRGGPGSAPHMLRALGGEDVALARVALDSLERIYVVEFGRPAFGAGPSKQLERIWTRWSKECRDLAIHERYWLAAERRDSRLRGQAVLELVRSPKADERARRRAATLAAGMAAGKDVRVRAPACAALWRLGQAAGAAKLLADLGSAEWPSRYYACRAAGTVRSRDVALALVRLLGDETAAIRAAAHRSLQKLRGAPGPAYDPEAPVAARRAAQALWKKWAALLNMAPGKTSGGKRLQ
jgi:HEAT repeat protein